MKRKVFLIGLDDFNREMLERIRGADSVDFCGLLAPSDVIKPEHFPLEHMLAKAENHLHCFREGVHAITGYIDFPVSDMIPILVKQFELPSPSLEAVLKCEHKYWSRVEQRVVIPEHTPFFNRFDPFAEDPLDQIQLDFPFWIKPVKSFSSYLGFCIREEAEFRAAVEVLRRNIRRVGDPFNSVLRRAQLPAEIAGVDGNWCVAEQLMEGRQCTLEGWVHDRVAETYGVIDSIRAGKYSSFGRYQYPSALPEAVRNRMDYAARRFLAYIGYNRGVFNIEFFWDEERDRIWLLEVNPRISASHSPLFELVDGVSNHQAAVDVARGFRPQMPQREGRFSCAAKFMLRHFGGDALVRRAPAPEEIARVAEELPGSRVQVDVREGQRLSELRDQDSYSFQVGALFLGGRDEAELRAGYEKALELLPFEFEAEPEARASARNAADS